MRCGDIRKGKQKHNKFCNGQNLYSDTGSFAAHTLRSLKMDSTKQPTSVKKRAVQRKRKEVTRDTLHRGRIPLDEFASVLTSSVYNHLNSLLNEPDSVRDVFSEDYCDTLYDFFKTVVAQPDEIHLERRFLKGDDDKREGRYTCLLILREDRVMVQLVHHDNHPTLWKTQKSEKKTDRDKAREVWGNIDVIEQIINYELPDAMSIEVGPDYVDNYFDQLDMWYFKRFMQRSNELAKLHNL